MVNQELSENIQPNIEFSNGNSNKHIITETAAQLQRK